jgi:hypothetical protein
MKKQTRTCRSSLPKSDEAKMRRINQYPSSFILFFDDHLRWSMHIRTNLYHSYGLKSVCVRCRFTSSNVRCRHRSKARWVFFLFFLPMIANRARYCMCVLTHSRERTSRGDFWIATRKDVFQMSAIYEEEDCKRTWSFENKSTRKICQANSNNNNNNWLYTSTLTVLQNQIWKKPSLHKSEWYHGEIFVKDQFW